MLELIPVFLLTILLIEIIFQLSWFKPYFKNGVPIYIKKYQFFGVLKDPFDPDYLEQKTKSKSTCSIFFRKFNNYECGFREKLWEMRLLNYIPIMRGVLRANEKKASFYIIGYLNWYVLLFVSYIVFSAISGTGVGLSPFLIIILIIYAIQIYRYNGIAEVAFNWLKENK